MPGFGRWLLGLASALCVLDRGLAGGFWCESWEPWGLQYHGCSSVLTECQIPDWHPAISGFRKAGNTPNLNIYSKRLSNNIIMGFPHLLEFYKLILIHLGGKIKEINNRT